MTMLTSLQSVSIYLIRKITGQCTGDTLLETAWGGQYDEWVLMVFDSGPETLWSVFVECLQHVRNLEFRTCIGKGSRSPITLRIVRCDLDDWSVDFTEHLRRSGKASTTHPSISQWVRTFRYCFDIRQRWPDGNGLAIDASVSIMVPPSWRMWRMSGQYGLQCGRCLNRSDFARCYRVNESSKPLIVHLSAMQHSTKSLPAIQLRTSG